MPTASAHLAAALDLLDDPALAAGQHLASGAPYAAFMMGTISPDVRVVNGLSREATHFYDIPLNSDKRADQLFLDTYPVLAAADLLPLDQAAFVAGYITHLVMDEVWLEVVVMPYIFIDQAVWATDHPNYRLYSLLMTYLAEQGNARVPPAMMDALRAAQPHNWLPFASDRDLVKWRDRVIRYALADSGWQTAKMFAHELGEEAEALYEVVASEEAMDRDVFSVVPRVVLEAFQRQTRERCIANLNAYLSTASV